MVRRLLRWLLDVENVDDSSARALRKRIEDVEDDVSRLETRYNRLRGWVTGGVRRDPDERDDEDEDDEQLSALELLERSRRGGPNGGR